MLADQNAVSTSQRSKSQIEQPTIGDLPNCSFSAVRPDPPTVGQFAAKLVHKLGNPLTAVNLNLFALINQLKPGSPELEGALLVNEDIRRLQRTLQAVSGFAHATGRECGAVSARALTENVERTLSSQLEERSISLKTEVYGGKDLGFYGEPTQIQEAIVGLIQNSAESIGERGIITLVARDATIRVEGGTRPGIVFEIEDSGKGIPREIQGRVFEPFFSTKKGAVGLGLTLAARIATNHGGYLEFECGDATVFRMAFPLSDSYDEADTY